MTAPDEPTRSPRETFEIPVRAPRHRPVAPSPRSITLALSGLCSALLLALLSVLPVPYAILGAGPTFDVFEEVEDQPLVSIDGAPTYAASGELRITTVALSRASTQRASLGPLLRAYFSPSHSVSPESVVYGDEEATDEEEDERAQQDFITSQEVATLAALNHLDIDVPAQMLVVEVMPESRGLGVLREQDEIIRVNGTDVVYFEDLSGELESMVPGAEIFLTVLRDGVETEISFPTIDVEGEARMGVWIDPVYDLPFDVQVAIDNVGGPSAGLVFSLAIIDLLTEQDELRGARIAGTGTIGTDGDVGPIGGIPLKLAGARRDGADWFLAPVENCPEVAGRIPGGLSVVAVDTLDDALAAVIAIGEGRTDDLLRCE